MNHRDTEAQRVLTQNGLSLCLGDFVVKNIVWPDKSTGSLDLVGISRRVAGRGMDAEKQLRFPPINLWVVASLPRSKPPKEVRPNTAARIHRRQRPGFSAKRPNALNSHVNGRTQDGCADQNTLICEERGNRNFRAARRRKAMDTLSTVRTNIHRRLESLLAVRGGKL